MNWIKKHLMTMILVLIFLAGLGLLLYPTVSDYWNSFHQSRAVVSYIESVTNIDDKKYEELWNSAVAYNKELAETGIKWTLTDEEKEEYDEYLKVDDTGIMAYIEIPEIDCSLPIYHGTEESVLQIAIGHIEGTSLPVGGGSGNKKQTTCSAGDLQRNLSSLFRVYFEFFIFRIP